MKSKHEKKFIFFFLIEKIRISTQFFLFFFFRKQTEILLGKLKELKTQTLKQADSCTKCVSIDLGEEDFADHLGETDTPNAEEEDSPLLKKKK